MSIDTPPLTITYSDMQTYQQCPRQWYFRSYRKLRPKVRPLTGALPMGSRIHKALELAEKGTVDTPLRAWAHLIETDRNALLGAGWGTDDLDKEDVLGRKMLEGFAEWEADEGFYAEYRVESVEAGLTDYLTFPELPGVVVKMRAKLDRVLVRRSDGSRWVNDYKTAGNFAETTLNGMVRSPQARHYALMLQQQTEPDQWIAGAVFTLLKKVLRTARANPPFYMNLMVPLTEWDIESYRLRTVALIDRMTHDEVRLTRGEDHRRVVPFAPAWHCNTCPFKHPCNLMQDTGIEAAEDYLADNFEAGDPWERYETSE